MLEIQSLREFLTLFTRGFICKAKLLYMICYNYEQQSCRFLFNFSFKNNHLHIMLYLFLF
ncbi:hypothetical protein CWB71_18865 [Pseudoalteromonas sp. S983]|nr:hypothetical protein CWB71_18865 [Pseudoalteromonas sp. S983]